MLRDVIPQSVTKNDYPTDAGRRGAVISFLAPGLGGQWLTSLPTIPPPYWSESRDEILRATPLFEDMWSSAVYTACAKIAALSWELKGPTKESVHRFQQLLLDGNWSKFIYRHMRDFLTTDNGAFLEIVRADKSQASRITGIVPLDSRRCKRTGDPDIPVIYRDRKNQLHEMKYYQVISIADMPDPSDTYYGVGLCAASRAYKTIYKLAALESYVTEKIVGRRPLAIYFVNNVSQTQVEQSMRSAEEQANASGYTSYMGAVVVANIDPSASSNVSKIDLAGLPDRFEPKEERLNSYLKYADAIGIDPQELSPELLASKAIGSGAQSKVIDDKASGKGVAAWKQAFLHEMNEWVLPDTVQFFFRERDNRDLLQAAELENRRTTTQAARVTAGILTADEAKQIMADQGDIPREFILQDMITTEVLSDTDKPRAQGAISQDYVMMMLEEQQREEEEQQAQMEQQMQAEAPPPPATGGQPGGNRMSNNRSSAGAKQDATKEYAELRLEQAFREIDAQESDS